MDLAMITHKYRTLDVAVPGGALRVGIWDPVDTAHGGDAPSVLAVHGITSSNLAWPLVVSQLPGTRVIAPDLRGRGSSHAVEGTAGMRRHAEDLLAVLDALGLEQTPVIGHSMGAFVAVALSGIAPERVSRLVLVDGGLPFDVPEGFSPEQLAQAVLGPTAERLSMRFDSVEHYLDFWRPHPAFRAAWSDEVETYFAYDLVPHPEGGLRSATSLQTTGEDIYDLNTGRDVPESLAALEQWGRPVLFVSVPRGLTDAAPLYEPDYLDRMLPRYPTVRHVALPDLNHYTVVMGGSGAAALGELLRAELGG